jgi:hypothetical protein
VSAKSRRRLYTCHVGTGGGNVLGMNFLVALLSIWFTAVDLPAQVEAKGVKPPEEVNHGQCHNCGVELVMRPVRENGAPALKFTMSNRSGRPVEYTISPKSKGITLRRWTDPEDGYWKGVWGYGESEKDFSADTAGQLPSGQDYVVILSLDTEGLREVFAESLAESLMFETLIEFPGKAPIRLMAEPFAPVDLRYPEPTTK